MEEVTFIQKCFDEYDDTFTWYVPPEKEKEAIKSELIRETENNPHLYINKYSVKDVIVLAKHKGRNDILFFLPGGECLIAHLVYENSSQNDEMHFVFFSSCKLAVKYIIKQYRIEHFGEKEFVLTQKDRLEIILFILQFVLFLILPKSCKGILMVAIGIILYIMIISDWKANGFNVFRDRKLYRSKVMPFLKYQFVYITIMTMIIILGVAILTISEILG